MLSVLLAITLMVGLPLAGFTLLFALMGRADRRRLEVVARQIALTDAIHREMGPVAAPVVARRNRGWRVSMAVPFERPAMVGELTAITRRTLDGGEDRPVEIVLSPMAPVTRKAA